jgi:hypothetical protein
MRLRKPPKLFSFFEKKLLTIFQVGEIVIPDRSHHGRDENQKTKTKKMKTKSGKTLAMTDVRRAYRRTRKSENASLCKKYNTASSMTAHYLHLVDINKRMSLAAICRQLEAATIDGDFATGAKLSRQIQNLKAALA